MAQLFEDEKKYPDNRTRDNFVFLGYPHEPALARDDYRQVIRDLEADFPIRLWYFLDEITTAEMMRKIWRAVLRADLAIFDVSRGNPLLVKTSAARKIKEVSYHIFDSSAAPTREDLETSTRKLLHRVFTARRVTKQQAEEEFADRGRCAEQTP